MACKSVLVVTIIPPRDDQIWTPIVYYLIYNLAMAKTYINPGPIRFTAIINDNSAIEFPFDLKETYGVGNLVPFKATFDGRVVYQGSLAKMGGPKALILLRKDKAAELGKGIGDSVEVMVELDDKPRELEVPNDLSDALAGAGVLEAFEQLAFTHRREFVQWVSEAKRPETRISRITKTCEVVAARQHR